MPATKPGLASSASKRAAGRKQHHDHAGEAGLGGGGAHLVLQPRLVAERLGALAQQQRQVASRAALDQARGHERIDARGTHASAHGLQGLLGTGPGRQLGGHPAQLVGGRAGQARRRLGQARRAASARR